MPHLILPDLPFCLLGVDHDSSSLPFSGTCYPDGA
jgi:hypothetical protein